MVRMIQDRLLKWGEGDDKISTIKGIKEEKVTRENKRNKQTREYKHKQEKVKPCEMRDYMDRGK